MTWHESRPRVISASSTVRQSIPPRDDAAGVMAEVNMTQCSRQRRRRVTSLPLYTPTCRQQASEVSKRIIHVSRDTSDFWKPFGAAADSTQLQTTKYTHTLVTVTLPSALALQIQLKPWKPL